MKILFLHGLESTPETSNSAKAIANAFDNQHTIVIPHYNPSNRTYFQVKWYLEDLCIQYNFDIVIGISLGGFWALNLTRFTNTNKVIMINPAIERGEERYNIKLNHPNDVIGKMILNMDDDIVDNQKNVDRFTDKFSITTFEKGGHRCSNMDEIIPIIEQSIIHMETFIP